MSLIDLEVGALAVPVVKGASLAEIDLGDFQVDRTADPAVQQLNRVIWNMCSVGLPSHRHRPYHRPCHRPHRCHHLLRIVSFSSRKRKMI